MSDDRAVWLEYHEAEIAKRDEHIAELRAVLGKCERISERVEALVLELKRRLSFRCLCCRVDCAADCGCQDKEVPPG